MFQEQRVCVRCGVGYVAKSPRRRWCSETCRLEGLREAARRHWHDARECRQCEKPFQARTRQQVYCSRACADDAYQQRHPPQNASHLLPLGRAQVGGWAELLVAAELTRRGWHVFRAVCDHAPCDLLAIDPEGCIQRVEVTTGVETKRGLSYPKHHQSAYDVLVVVTTKGIHFFPEAPS